MAILRIKRHLLSAVLYPKNGFGEVNNQVLQSDRLVDKTTDAGLVDRGG
jgi:hypothetical protein